MSENCNEQHEEMRLLRNKLYATQVTLLALAAHLFDRDQDLADAVIADLVNTSSDPSLGAIGVEEAELQVAALEELHE